MPRCVVLPAGSPEYARALAGGRKPLGERWDRRGRHWVAFPVRRGRGTGRAAGEFEHQMEFSPDHFSKIRLDYSSWPEKWWREAIQNAVDAGARQIECGSIPPHEGEPLWRVWCEDDGGGMTRDVLLSAFLKFSGTTKRGEFGGMRGGFGRAKELLILPWARWEVRSRDTVVTGVANRYNVADAPPLRGTRITAWMAAGWNEHTGAQVAQSFIRKCWLPGVRFDGVSGQADGSVLRYEVTADEKVGELIREFPLPDGRVGVRLYYNRDRQAVSSQLLVRTGGLYSFALTVSAEVPGTLIAEVAVPSVEVLLSNREGFREETGLKAALERFTNELAADVKTALRRKANVFRRIYQGSEGPHAATRTSRYLAMRLQEELPAPRELEEAPAKKKAERDLTARRQEELANKASSKIDEVRTTRVATPRSREVGGEESRESRAASIGEDQILDDAGLDLFAGPAAVRVAVSAARPANVTDYESVVQQLVWRPPFMVWNEIPGFSPDRKFFPETMSPTARRLAVTWAELCRLVMIRLNSGASFGIGWIFSDDQSAGAYRAEDGFDWLLLNPLRPGGRLKVRSDWQDRERVTSLVGYTAAKRSQATWNAGSWGDVRTLFALAIHEATHIADGINYHNEAFAGALTWNTAQMLGTAPVARRLVRAIGQDLAPRAQRRLQMAAAPRSLDERPRSLSELAEALQTGLRQALAARQGQVDDPPERWFVRVEEGQPAVRLVAAPEHWSGGAREGWALWTLAGLSLENPATWELRTLRGWAAWIDARILDLIEREGATWYWEIPSLG